MKKLPTGRHKNRGFKVRKRLNRTGAKAISQHKNAVLKLIDSGLLQQIARTQEGDEVQS